MLADDFVLDAVLPNAEDEPAPLLHEVLQTFLAAMRLSELPAQIQ